jgi:predicted metal-dependent phosphotriesterase family hydrolase
LSCNHNIRIAMDAAQPPLHLIAVDGPMDPGRAGITDAHNHVWIERVPGAEPGAPVLDNQKAITVELGAYRAAGGNTILDCQPGGCGRNGRKLSDLTEASGVKIIACTGYHLRKYYPPDYWLFTASVEVAQAYLVRELQSGLSETMEGRPVRAGFVKIACEATVERSLIQLMEAAVAACYETGAALAVHTEKGAGVEQIVTTLTDFGLPASRLILCHMDKRPDFGLHQVLAQEGILLEYDTFYRKKYHPTDNLWPLLERMVAAGLAARVALATDMAEASFWVAMGGKPGLAALLTDILPRMHAFGFGEAAIQRMAGGNIAARLARPVA